MNRLLVETWRSVILGRAQERRELDRKLPSSVLERHVHHHKQNVGGNRNIKGGAGDGSVEVRNMLLVAGGKAMLVIK